MAQQQYVSASVLPEVHSGPELVTSILRAPVLSRNIVRAVHDSNSLTVTVRLGDHELTPSHGHLDLSGCQVDSELVTVMSLEGRSGGPWAGNLDLRLECC
jgi:hypothetical protein